MQNLGFFQTSDLATSNFSPRIEPSHGELTIFLTSDVVTSNHPLSKSDLCHKELNLQFYFFGISNHHPPSRGLQTWLPEIKPHPQLDLLMENFNITETTLDTVRLQSRLQL